MTAPNRSHKEIIAAILDIAGLTSEGATKMKIMANVFISYETATCYLEKLIKEGLIVYHPDTNTYRATEQGKRKLC